ncbi:invasion associated locus B family protein [Suttonella indologenes]|uniref:Invasion protein B, involved in pathogenesis n=1 Tax=Suttonella indologenes TaxID=13276 RepID=A0A380MLS9_9GAMM|nr:invasion associated locus B family protein [Suttonella indologenes]SUO90293.1 Invasion protein B, involved in pathogenesis [Suttonella indologenes]SUO97926.1 Invasion protein B, involved in pathogenesis [Suttonella indologenes]
MKFKQLLIAAVLGTGLAAQAAVTNGQKYGDWQGVCQEGMCGIMQEAKNQAGTVVGLLAIRKVPEANNQAVLFITVPLGVVLHAGIGIAVDTKEVKSVPLDYCSPGGCHVAIPLESDILNKIKAGNKLQIATFAGGQQQTVEFSLKGVTSGINAL